MRSTLRAASGQRVAREVNRYDKLLLVDWSLGLVLHMILSELLNVRLGALVLLGHCKASQTFPVEPR